MRFPRSEFVRILSRSILLAGWGILLCLPVIALDRDRALSQFHHTSWTAKDGAPSQINSLAQTEDGFLWIGSERGLFRFDGVQFEPLVPPAGVELPSHSISSLLATPDGGLWIAFDPTGVAFLKDGLLTISGPAEAAPRMQIYEFARDLEGRIWAGTHFGLLVFERGRWQEIGTGWNAPTQRIWSLYVDRSGTLWVATENAFFSLSRGASSFQRAGPSGGGVPQIGQGPDGKLWFTQYGKPLRPINLGSGEAASSGAELRVPARRFLFDREGSLWLTVAEEGIRRLRFPERLGAGKLEANDPAWESFSAREGLSDSAPGVVLEDREGNIWVATNKGLDRFRHSHLVPFPLPPGYRGLTLLPGDHGDLWVGSAASRPILHLSEGKIVPLGAPVDLVSVYRDGTEVWWGGNGQILRQHKAEFTVTPQPRELSFDSKDWFWEVFPNRRDGGVWAGIGDVGVFGFKNGVWTGRPLPAGLLERVPSASYEDSTGRVLLGYTENRVAVVDGDQVRNYTQADGIDIGRIRVIRGRGPRYWLGGELGLALFENGRFRSVRTAHGDRFGTVSGIVETADGALWLNELRGVVRIDPEEVRRAGEDPNHAVTYQLFDFADGLPGGPQMDFRSSTAVEATDGRLWFATDNGLVSIDPNRLKRNEIPPPVAIRSLDTEVKKYLPTGTVDLPARTTSLRIDYTALSLSIPERIQFRYKLAGIADDWHDAGNRREASYTNLGPGDYSFQVIACNNDGIWNETGAMLKFSIAPAWYQTTWFPFLCALGVILAVIAIYRLRLRQVAHGINARFDERLAERTRLARDLHDTFLQTVQGSKMIADDILDQPPDPVRLRRTLEQLSVWLGEAVTEGRAALNSLRTSTTEKNDLAAALRHVAETDTISGAPELTFSVAGTTRDIHPIVRDEVYRIAYEAIRNARAHSKATRLIIELSYEHDLTVRVKDNGAGIHPVIVAQGKEGHFGLRGMRERARRIGADLTIISSPNLGTDITLTVPRGIAFHFTNRLD
jgi:ligand-binding sensor domain-containing protein